MLGTSSDDADEPIRISWLLSHINSKAVLLHDKTKIRQNIVF